jgi:hypothetical protein
LVHRPPLGSTAAQLGAAVGWGLALGAADGASDGASEPDAAGVPALGDALDSGLHSFSGGATRAPVESTRSASVRYNFVANAGSHVSR